MTTRATTTRAQIQRAIEAAQATGAAVRAVTVGSDGSIRVDLAQPDEGLEPNRGIVQPLRPKQWARRG